MHSDGSYERSILYIDKVLIPKKSNDIFQWHETGNRIELNTEGDEVVKYQVGENQLFRLDRDGHRITGSLAAHYVLQKHQHDIAIENKHWRLIELRGNAVESDRDAVLILRAENAVVSGNSSCNSFSGTYAIKSGQRISFGRNMTATMMACPDMSIEQGFFEVLRMADNYSLSGDGKLSLNRARMAPLARFEVVE